MSYQIIQPPFTLQFREMTKKDLLAYSTWFHENTQPRIAELARVVNSTAGYEEWVPSMTPDSLSDLGRWFEGQVETRKKSAEELAETHAKMTFPIDVSKVELTNRTLSLAMDISMYFAQVVLNNLPGTRWDQLLDNKRFVDYGQPVIVGFGKVPLNPLRLILVIASKISDKIPASLPHLYETWARMRA